MDSISSNTIGVAAVEQLGGNCVGIEIMQCTIKMVKYSDTGPSTHATITM
jgi:hypothetical protein